MKETELGVQIHSASKKAREINSPEVRAARSNLPKLGFQLLAVTIAKSDFEKQFDDKLLEKTREFVRKRPNIIFSSTGRGKHSDRITISIHEDFADYFRFTREIKREYGEFCTLTETFLVSLKSDQILRPLSVIANTDLFERGKKS